VAIWKEGCGEMTNRREASAWFPCTERRSILNDLLGVAGTPCTVNRDGDLFMEYEAREFIGAKCVIVKRTKSGLIQVALAENKKRVYSVPARNIDLDT
jgi:hypothetical protein